MRTKDRMRFLLVLASADGGFSREELRMLADRALEWGLSDDQFESLLDEAMSGTTELVLPKTQEERFQLVKEMIQMMAADGRMDSYEKAIFATVAARMKLSDEDLNQLIDSALKESDADP